MRVWLRALMLGACLMQALPLTVEANSCCEEFYSCPFSEFSVEAKVSGFYPFESKVRRIYSDVWANYEVEASANLWNNWHLWGEGGYLRNSGHSIGLHDKTTLRMVPISLGLKYVYCFNSCLDAYVGAGATYSFLRIRDHSPYVHEHVSKNAWGAMVKSGLYYHVNDWLFFDLFVDYLYQRFSFHKENPADPDFVVRHDLDMSGLKFGLGIGIEF